MYLLIDNSNNGELRVYFTLNTKWVHLIFRAEKENKLLLAVSKCMARANKKISDLRGVAVVVGKGGFTSTRVAATTANILAYALQIPVVAVNEPDTGLVASLLKLTPVGRYISAKYSGEANIGKKIK